MRKLRLELETLAVESFGTGQAGGVGTVRGRADAFGAGPVEEGEIAITATLWQTCPNTCQGDTCYISCVTRCSCPTLPCDTCA